MQRILKSKHKIISNKWCKRHLMLFLNICCILLCSNSPPSIRSTYPTPLLTRHLQFAQYYIGLISDFWCQKLIRRNLSIKNIIDVTFFLIKILTTWKCLWIVFDGPSCMYSISQSLFDSKSRNWWIYQNCSYFLETELYQLLVKFRLHFPLRLIHIFSEENVSFTIPIISQNTVKWEDRI